MGETTRYDAALYIDPWSSEDQIWSKLASVPDAQRRTLDAADSDNHIVSVIELDGRVDAPLEPYPATTLSPTGATVADRIAEELAGRA